MIQSTDPYGDGWGGGGGGGSSSGGGIDTGITGGTDPGHPPTHRPIGGHGWWTYVAGVWKWFTDPVAPTVKQIAP